MGVADMVASVTLCHLFETGIPLRPEPLPVLPGDIASVPGDVALMTGRGQQRARCASGSSLPLT